MLSLPDYTPIMRWAVVGSRGMLGSDLVSYLESNGEDVTGFHRGNLDLSSQDSVASAGLADFDVVVNCVAYTKVDLAEDEPDAAFEANAAVPRRLAGALTGYPTKLIHISTDYVFDGKGETPYSPLDERSPLGVYGKTKAAGEDAVLEANPLAQLVRTSWLYGANGACFPKTIASKLLDSAELRVVDDQIGSPTHTLDLAEFIYRAVVSGDQRRILHGVSSGSCSWFEFAQAIRESVGGAGGVSPVPSSEYLTKAPRPLYSVLEPSVVDSWQMADWRTCWERAADIVLG